MQVKFDLQVGKNTFTIIEDVHSHTDFFKKMAFYSDLPKVGPNGEDDLKIVYRNPKNYEYYSIVSEKAGMELKFGQLKEPEGALFKKDWEPLFHGDQAAQGAQPVAGGLGAPVAQPAQQAAPAPAAGLGATAPAPAAAPQPAAAAPAPVATQPAPQTTQPAAAPPQANPQVEQAAASILDKYGI